MSDALTRTQFALDALVAAGHVSQAKVDAALALFPAPAGEPSVVWCVHCGEGVAVFCRSKCENFSCPKGLRRPAGEPEMPEVNDLAQEIRRVDGNHSLGAGALAEALMPFFSAYGDARAEHARRVALDVGVRTGHPPGMLQDDDRKLSKALASKPDAMRHAREAVAAIAAAPPQGAQT